MKTQLRQVHPGRSEDLRQTRCRLMLLKCYRTSENGSDEIFLKLGDKKIWPVRPFAKIKPMEEFIVNLHLISDGRGYVRVDLWEKDLFTDDHLGFFQFVAVGTKGTYSTDLTPDNKDGFPPKYVLTWEM